MENGIIFVSKKRLLLAVYIDFLLYTVAATLLVHFTALDGAGVTLAKVLVFLVLEAIFFKTNLSPGRNFLSIYHDTLPIEGIPTKVTLVNPKIYSKETAYTIFFGVIFVLEGTKAAVRWIDSVSITSFLFGFAAGKEYIVGLSIVWAMLFVLLGYFFLKLKKEGFWLAIFLAVAGSALLFTSWNSWDEIARELVINRNALRGHSPREGEIEFVQAVFPEIFIFMYILMAFTAFAVRKRLTE